MTLIDSIKHRFSEGKILILGWGREGQSTRELLRQIWPDRPVWVADQNISQFADDLTIPHSGYLQDLEQFAVIWKTPGISVHQPELELYLQAHGVVTSQLNEVLLCYRDKMIGITGTKGKSTTTALLAALLTAAGKKVVMGGNIGIPLFGLVAEMAAAEWLVVEMSSYMLEIATLSPHIAVFLNVFPEHLDYHGSWVNYLDSKRNITRFQTSEDYLLVNATDNFGQVLAQETQAQVRSFQPAADATKQGNLSSIVSQKIWPVIVVAAKLLGVGDQALERTKRTFQGLPHRLERVATVNGVTFYDDTLATVPEAAIAALEAVPETSVILLGGHDRGIDYASIVEAVVNRHIPHVLLFPPSGQKMAELLAAYPENAQPHFQVVHGMPEAVQLAAKLAPPDSAVLLSPASPSFGQFHDYEAKSAAFKEEIAKLHSP